MAKDVLPEGWRMYRCSWWTDDPYDSWKEHGIVLERWIPARLTRFRKKIVPGYWHEVARRRAERFAPAWGESMYRAVEAEFLQTARLIVRDELNLKG